ncbi:MAG: riboflavin synthase [Actinomycetota bacterium]|nr:riboflavin synthase [Actinomycetota bacterium]
MFTGIVEEVGTVRHVVRGTRSCALTIAARTVLEGTRVGDSINTNGVCLTVTSLEQDAFTADVMPQTLSKSNLSALSSGDPVDLERAMPADGRFGGHLVTGHIDGTGTVASRREDDNAIRMRIHTSPALTRLMVDQGSVAVDGISLTLTQVEDAAFEVSLIPHTAQRTILVGKRVGDTVNIECDLVGKYVQRLLKAPRESSSREEGGITMAFLEKHGF